MIEPIAHLVSAIGVTDTVLKLDKPWDIEYPHLVIDDEFMTIHRFLNHPDGSVDFAGLLVYRAAHNSMVAPHAAGAEVWEGVRIGPEYWRRYRALR